MKEIKLSKQGKNRNKFVAMVDDDDYNFLNQYNWYAWKCGNTYYAVRKEKNPDKFILMHREILGVCDNISIDHKDRNGLNNQKENIRISSNSSNQHNKIGWGKSGYKGVYIRRYKDNIKFRAMIQVDKKPMHLGYFASLKQAAEAYDKAAIMYFGEFARTNY